VTAGRALLVLLCGLGVAAAGLAQKASPGQVAYVEGLRAFDAGDYATAAARMRTALAEDPKEAASRFRYRAQNAEDYFPHLWLGLSLEKLGEREGALASLVESRRQGVAASRPALARILAAAVGRLTPQTPVPTPVPTSAPPVPLVPVPEATPPPARETAAPPLPSAPRPTATPDRTRTSPGPTLPPIAESASPALRAGLRAFFRGEYADAERLLEPLSPKSPLARAFLAWSLGGRYLLAADRDPELLSRARREYAAALLAGGPANGGPWVSPAILALFGAADPAR